MEEVGRRKHSADDVGATDIRRMRPFRTYLAISTVHDWEETVLDYKKDGVP